MDSNKKALQHVQRQVNQLINEISTGEHRVRMHVGVLADAIKVLEYLQSKEKVSAPKKDTN